MRERVLLLGTTEYVFLNVFSFTLFFLTKVRLGVEADIDIYIYCSIDEAVFAVIFFHVHSF